VPTSEERQMLERALDDVEREPGAGRSWQEIRDDLRSAE